MGVTESLSKIIDPAYFPVPLVYYRDKHRSEIVRQLQMCVYSKLLPYRPDQREKQVGYALQFRI